MFGLYKRRGVPPRHRNSPFMNLAYGKVPTIETADWDTDPVGLANLTDEQNDTHLTTDGATVVTAANDKGIKIDLGRIYEVYEIKVKNRSGEGVKTNNASNAGGMRLKTSTDDTTYTDRSDDQVAAGTAFEDADIDFKDNGIAVRYVLIEFRPDGTYFLTTDLSGIEVYGC